LDATLSVLDRQFNTITNRKGDKRSPYVNPLPPLKKPTCPPLGKIMKDGEEIMP